MRHNKIKKLKKNQKPHIVDLSNDGAFTVVSLSDHLTKFWKDKKKKIWKVLNKEGQLDQRFITQELPHWQDIWIKRGIKIRWDRRQRSFFLSAIKIK